MQNIGMELYFVPICKLKSLSTFLCLEIIRMEY